MSSQILEIFNELAELRAMIRQAVALATAPPPAASAIPKYYKFPEDIVTMTGGHIPVGTIRRWKTAGYLRTTKLGSRSFVTPADWQWFMDRHQQLMAASPNNRGASIAKSRQDGLALQ